MILVCAKCQQELANVEPLYPFNIAVTCGNCGYTAGLKLEPTAPLPLESEPAKHAYETKDGHYFIDGAEVSSDAWHAAVSGSRE